MKLSRTTAALSAAALAAVLAGCGTTGATSGSGSTASGTTATSTATATAGASVAAVLADNQESHATADDLTYDEADVVDVTLSGGTATADGDGVEVDGATVTITAPGTYRLTGTLAGQVVVDTSAEGDVRDHPRRRDDHLHDDLGDRRHGRGRGGRHPRRRLDERAHRRLVLRRR